MSERISFRYLDNRDGRTLPILKTGEEEFSIPEWYRNIWDVSFSELSDFDVTRALGQKIHTVELLPFAISRVEQDIGRGDLYEGDMLMGLVRLGVDFWSKSKYKSGFLNFLSGRVHEIPDDLQGEVKQFLSGDW